MGREHGANVMRVLERKAEAVAGTFNAQDVANTLWAYAASKAMVAVQCLLHTVVQRLLVTRGQGWCLHTSNRYARSIRSSGVREVFFVGCSVEPRLGMEAITHECFERDMS
jgi:hypothetical protein